MGVLLIKCPKTGREFSTGIQVAAETLVRVPQEFTHTRCPYCKAEHSWLPREAELQLRTATGSKIRIEFSLLRAVAPPSR